MAEDKVSILLLGAGGREHALLVKLAQSPCAGKIYVAPGNGGMYDLAEKAELDPESPEAVAAFAKEHGVGLVVIGPEAPLVKGVGDAVRAAGIPVFGPNAEAAQMEGSKEFAKHVMEKAGVPTAAWKSFTDEDACAAYVKELAGPCVVKADGLAAGKGVIVANTTEEALEGVHECFSGHFGDAGKTVVVEEMLKGPECSLLALTDGTTLVPLATSQDHKRALDGDRGLNTGGMGVYSPVPILLPGELDRMVEIEQKVVDELRREGITYSGCLYGGFMLTKDGPKVLEFNARFGDPEAQVVLPRMKGDLVEAFLACDAGTLSPDMVSWDDDWAVSVVLTSAGYPGSYEKGKKIVGVEDANAMPGVMVYHAGTALDADGSLVTAGGRVLDVTAVADTFEDARNLAYEACDKIWFEGKTYRHDIGIKAIKGRAALEA
ncbi:MAG: phosphoribosylamine--glycine ligase [Atopobiaceae bacterium]|jgi:phosphoribosylamine--glycine ligase|nr:phosphoribosylamine--glycine ligase [Atopobiaceae bacterium]MCI2050812.1 phosphoribosylamine--glycine ligase [Atopobiaceae bacterium]